MLVESVQLDINRVSCQLFLGIFGLYQDQMTWDVSLSRWSLCWISQSKLSCCKFLPCLGLETCNIPSLIPIKHHSGPCMSMGRRVEKRQKILTCSTFRQGVMGYPRCHVLWLCCILRPSRQSQGLYLGLMLESCCHKQTVKIVLNSWSLMIPAFVEKRGRILCLWVASNRTVAYCEDFLRFHIQIPWSSSNHWLIPVE